MARPPRNQTGLTKVARVGGQTIALQRRNDGNLTPDPASVYFAEIAGNLGGGVENNPSIANGGTGLLNLTAIVGDGAPYITTDDGSGNINGVSVNTGFYTAMIVLYFYTDPTGAKLNFGFRGAGPWAITAFNRGGPDSGVLSPLNATQTVDTGENCIVATCMFQSGAASVLGVDLVNNSGGTLALMDISDPAGLSNLTIYRLTPWPN